MPQAVGRPKTREIAVNRNPPGRPRKYDSLKSFDALEKEIATMDDMKAKFTGERPARCVVTFEGGRCVEYRIKSYSLINSVLTLVTATGERLLNWPKVEEFEVVDL